MRFQDVPVNHYFRLEPNGRSFLKSSPFGYYLDPIMGEMQVQGDLEVVYPILAPAAPALKKEPKPKAAKSKKTPKRTGKPQKKK